MEFGIVLGFAYWGYHVGTCTLSKILIAIGAPVVVFSFWGFIDFHQAGRMAVALRLRSGRCCPLLGRASDLWMDSRCAFNRPPYHGLCPWWEALEAL